MTQEPLFHEDIFEAIRTAVMSLGGMKKAGAMLWPDKPADKAGELMANCLNRTRPEKLDPEQVMLLARESRKLNCHAIAHYFNASTGYAEPIPVEPEDERARLQREYIAATQLLDKISKRLAI